MAEEAWRYQPRQRQHKVKDAGYVVTNPIVPSAFTTHARPSAVVVDTIEEAQEQVNLWPSAAVYKAERVDMAPTVRHYTTCDLVCWGRECNCEELACLEG